jgi:hypothetical protein
VAGLLLCVLATGAMAQSAPASPPGPAATQAEAMYEPWRTDRFYLETSLYTHHFSYDPAHVDKQKLILGEWNITEQWLVGASFFDSSFRSADAVHVYGGWRYAASSNCAVLYQIVCGTRARLQGPVSKQIPFNHSGVAPGFTLRSVTALTVSARALAFLAQPACW